MAKRLKIDRPQRGIATIWLNRPERSNAIDQQMLDELAHELLVHGGDDRTRVVVLRGVGKHFCAGADLAARDAEPDAAAAHATLVDVLAALETLPKPTVAVVHGAAVGGGAALAACCDVALAAEGAFFSIPEVRVGMAPLGVAAVLIRAMGDRSFRRYGLSGERFSAAEAMRIGLVHDVVGADKLDDRLAEITDALLHGAPGAQRELKGGMKNAVAPLVATRRAADARQSAEAQEGIASFREKRKPNWYPPGPRS